MLFGENVIINLNLQLLKTFWLNDPFNEINNVKCDEWESSLSDIIVTKYIFIIVHS
uniref:Uncharacterized protein n=1 Tax=Arion vulgaris TaxID=1028688 RepID=A0A0B6ZVG9_9EUPU